MTKHKTIPALTQAEIQAKVLQCALFSHLPEKHLNKLLKNTRVISLQEKEKMFLQGQAANEFFLVVSGELKLALTSSMGQEKILHILKPGHTFAEALMFLEKPKYPASTTAITECVVLAFQNNFYKSILTSSPDACFGIMGEYSHRILSLISEIESLTTQNATFRVVRYLLQEIPSNQIGSTSIELQTPKHAIASRLSVTPETLSRILAKLKKQGAIDVSDKRVVIKNIDRMRKLLDQA